MATKHSELQNLCDHGWVLNTFGLLINSLEAKSKKSSIFRVGCTLGPLGVAGCSWYHFKAKTLLITNLLVNMCFKCPKGLVSRPELLTSLCAEIPSFCHFVLYTHACARKTSQPCLFFLLYLFYPIWIKNI